MSVNAEKLFLLEPDIPMKTHFGYREVSEDQKASLVQEVFTNVAYKYDLMNDLMSFGIHRLWKDAVIDRLKPGPNMTLVDVGGGTGDLAFRFLAKGGGNVQVIDINREMLAQGQNRALDQGIISGIEWSHGDAEELPLDDMSMDAYTTAFCIRNVTHINRALAEARRVLKPGGQFLCLEFSQLKFPTLRSIYDAYSFNILPVLGEKIVGDRGSYQYLAESIRKFPNQLKFSSMIAESGLGCVSCQNLNGGIAAIHSAWRI